MAGTATIYVKQGCPHCEAACRALVTRGRRLRVVDLDSHPEALPELLKLSKGRRIVPVVVDGGRIAVAPDGGSEF